MDIRILMIGDDPCNVLHDIQLLRDKGFRVYTVFNYENINDVFKEIKPHIVFFNSVALKTSGRQHTKLIDSFLKRKSSIIYSINEDSTYMVVQYLYDINRKHVTIAEHMMVAVKSALRNIPYTSNTTLTISSLPIHLQTIR